MYFLSEDYQLSKTYTNICEKIGTAIKNKIDSRPSYNKKFFENQIMVLR